MAAVASNHWLSVFAALVAMLGSAGLGGMVKAWLDHKRGVRKDTDEVALSLVSKLQARVETVERDSMKERALCDARLAIQRHRVNNVTGNFQALLMMIELAPDRMSEVVTRLKARMAEQEQAEAVEKAALAAVAATYGVEMETVE